MRLFLTTEITESTENGETHGGTATDWARTPKEQKAPVSVISVVNSR